jgi:nucleotide-binding universal stress UspA family protein
MIRQILVPLDGSELAESILPFVEEFARLTGASLGLMQVIEPQPEAVGRWEAAPSALEEALAAAGRRAQRYLTGLAARLAPAGLGIRTEVTSGPTAETIIQRSRAFDLVAMATHGRSGIGRWVYGSVADKVLRGASVPVLLVRARADGAAAGGPLQRILVPLDGSPLAEQALPVAAELAQRAGAELALVQSVFWAQAPVIDPAGYGGAFAVAGLIEQAEADAHAYLEQAGRPLVERGLVVQTAVRFEPAADAILSVASEREADLIVMSTHGRSGLGRWVLGSVADRVLRAAIGAIDGTCPCPSCAPGGRCRAMLLPAPVGRRVLVLGADLRTDAPRGRRGRQGP